jgi:hypothetical protein
MTVLRISNHRSSLGRRSTTRSNNNRHSMQSTESTESTESNNNNNNKTTVMRKVQFHPRVRSRTVAVPMTNKELQTCWFTADELDRRIRKDKKLRYSLARDPSVYDSDCLCRIGLYTEKDRRVRYNRAKEARFAVFLEQNGTASESSSSSFFQSDDADSGIMAESYSHYSEIASHIAYKRGLEQSRHVEAVWNQSPPTLMMEPDPILSGPALRPYTKRYPPKGEAFNNSAKAA